MLEQPETSGGRRVYGIRSSGWDLAKDKCTALAKSFLTTMLVMSSGRYASFRQPL
jgi:hypothetical protein